MTRTLSIAALLIVAGCGQADQPVAPANQAVATVPAAPAVKPAVPSLKGQWRLATPALDLTIGDDTATLSSGCLRRGFTFRQTGNQVTFTSSPSSSSNCGGQSPSAAQEAAFSALADANLAVFAQDGRSVTLLGLGGMVALERR